MLVTRRIVQLTDCHLFADPSRELREFVTWSRFMTVLQDVRQRIPEFDLLVMTGDTAHDEAFETYQSVRGLLGPWIEKLKIIPGNHDDRRFLNDVFPETSGGLAERITFESRWENWQAIGLDSHITGQTSGSLGDEQRAWLRTRLQARPSLHTVLFLHHPPVLVQSPWLDQIRLQDATEFEQLLRDHPQVRVISCGHVHQEITASFAGGTLITTPAVGPQFRPRSEQLEIEPGPPGYRVLELHPDGRWSSQTLFCR